MCKATSCSADAPFSTWSAKGRHLGTYLPRKRLLLMTPGCSSLRPRSSRTSKHCDKRIRISLCSTRFGHRVLCSRASSAPRLLAGPVIIGRFLPRSLQRRVPRRWPSSEALIHPPPVSLNFYVPVHWPRARSFSDGSIVDAEPSAIEQRYRSLRRATQRACLAGPTTDSGLQSGIGITPTLTRAVAVPRGSDSIVTVPRERDAGVCRRAARADPRDGPAARGADRDRHGGRGSGGTRSQPSCGRSRAPRPVLRRVRRARRPWSAPAAIVAPVTTEAPTYH